MTGRLERNECRSPAGGHASRSGARVHMAGWIAFIMRTPRIQRSSGLRPPAEPPIDADALDVALFYLSYWDTEFARARLVVKSRASKVVVTVSATTAGIAVVGAATPLLGWTWLGLVSASLAGIATVVGAWDGLFRHRELWHQRSLVLGDIQALKRSVQVRAASGEDRDQLALEAVRALNEILAEDLATWSEIRSRQRPLSLENGNNAT